ncbi:type-1 angiotensin II receptor-associated protein-like [Xenia sp. Carnegie-2017]|uniref:type-1 angiotensin II receptor-associated protein-like n=1 Tax=Xenia sp. Carnegie-2017 TaxID=2897299 RepID=UPI001F038E7E|nr:type-1 angiotensin II receptor-associated protein-like [Xenia sp. Carnegie-2017]
MFCNFFVLALGVVTVVHSTDHTISELLILGMAFSLLHDIIIVAVTYDGDKNTPGVCKEKDHFRFSFGMSILNIILKPVSLVAIILNYLHRGDGGFRAKVAEFRANRGENNEPPNEPLPPVAYGNQTY